MTLVLLLQAKILYIHHSSPVYNSETTITPEEITTTVQRVIRNAESYRNDIAAGQGRIRQIRRYLDDMSILPAQSGDTQIGSPDSVQTFPSFETWVASFSRTSLGQEEEDDILLQEFKKKENSPPSNETAFAPVERDSPSPVRLIITDLKLKGASAIPTVEQLHFHSNTKVEEVLRVLKARGTVSLRLR
jgi:hypothetical protein